ncbi:MAG: phosphoribosylglycinamide synthetase C domain-containing protein, partial [Pseudomonadota bacterium]
PREISEVQGAICTYETLPGWNPASQKDFLQAHRMLMSDILVDAGKFHKGGVGIHKGSKVVHVAPPAKRVPILMADLLDWINTTDNHALIKSCVFHYELEFIHPFIDGNGRMGRLWQTLILGHWNALFYLLPIESLIKDQQDRYHQTLEQADQAASSTVFIEFMLDIIEAILIQNSQALQQSTQAMASHGYPGSYHKLTEIRNIERALDHDGVQVFHAGTVRDDMNRLMSNGGRVLNLVASGKTIADAQKRAYTAIEDIDWPNGFYRRDIGWRAVGGSRH